MSKIAGRLSVIKNGAISVDNDSDNIGFGPFGLVSGSTAPATYGLATNTSPTYALSGPGFYFISGSTQSTGTVPNPAMFPGAQLHVTMLNANGSMLSGSATAKTTVFSWSGMAHTGSVSGSNPTQFGNTLNVFPGGSVSLQSNGFYWQPYVSSGSLIMGL